MTPPANPIDRWKGEFGDAYVARNVADKAIVSVMRGVFARVLAPVSMAPPRSILEVGCNIGINLRALRLLGDAELFAVEPNVTARRRVLADGIVDAAHLFDATGDALPMADATVDLAFTAGVLIHIPEPHLQATMREIHRVSRRYVLCMEYFARNPETIRYRGHDDMLFKRDFGGLYLDLFPDLRIVADGFFWRRSTGADDLTWCLFEKS
ncbi:MAG: methyltransferase domain-containing protein [Alphaproteobacteria bacterium]|nr:methyltransferase domain-containing protein [Alphaproteobacteria bacterium]